MKNDIRIVEGFEKVGKTSFARHVCEEIGGRIWHPTHDLIDQTIGRQDSWTLGYAVLDYIIQIPQEYPVIIDRHVVSSYVYTYYYNKKILDPKIADFYKNNAFYKECVTHYHVQHRDKSTAEEIFNSSKSREANPNRLSAQYDKFSTFEDYWNQYKLFQELFLETYQRLEIYPTIVETYYGGWEVKEH